MAKIGVEMVIETSLIPKGTSPTAFLRGYLGSLVSYHSDIRILELAAYDMDEEVAAFMARLKKNPPPADKESREGS